MRIACLLFFFIFCYNEAYSTDKTYPQSEVRGVWIATVSNIDFPTRNNLSSDKQREEFVDLISALAKIGINTVFVQIRPSADAFYPSNIEPWSPFLTGTLGAPPNPYYDPLQFMINTCHDYNMEFHAWINPYRASNNIKTFDITKHPTNILHPDWFVKYGNQEFFNPGIPAVKDYVLNIIRDIIVRYNIDGLHIDDYFYPYPIQGISFNDKEAYKIYGHGLSLANWRRSNCDSIVHGMYDCIKSINPYIKFGVSPFGIWRSDLYDQSGSKGDIGLSSYDNLYADVLYWLKNKWMDYIIPQLYWEIDNPQVDFEDLLAWWNNHTFGRQLYIGMGLFQAKESRNKVWRDTKQFPKQLQEIRSYSNTEGCVFFSARDVLSNKAFCDSLRLDYFSMPTLLPHMDWIDNDKPIQPIIKKQSFRQYQIIIPQNTIVPIKGVVIYKADNNFDKVLQSAATILKIIYTHQNITINVDSLEYTPYEQSIWISTISNSNNVSKWVKIQ